MSQTIYCTSNAAISQGFVACRTMVSVAPSSETSVSGATCGTGTGWLMLIPQGTASTVQASEVAVAANAGFVWEDANPTALGTGNWTPTVKLSVSVGSLTADIKVRFYSSVPSKTPGFTSRGSTTFSNQTLTTTATVYTCPSTSVTGWTGSYTDIIFMDVQLNILTNSTGSSSATVALFMNGGSSEQLIMPDPLQIHIWFFHDAATTITDTLPGASTLSASTPGNTVSGASTNRAMDNLRGATQVALTGGAIGATTTQWFRRYVSSFRLAAQTIAASSSWGVDAAGSSTVAGGNVEASLIVWRPSNSSIVGRIFDNVTVGSTFTTSEQAKVLAGTGTGSAVTCADGDLLVLEYWAVSGSASTITLDYDGTTTSPDGTAMSSAAATVRSPVSITLFYPAGTPNPRPVQTTIQTAVSISNLY